MLPIAASRLVRGPDGSGMLVYFPPSDTITGAIHPIRFPRISSPYSLTFELYDSVGTKIAYVSHAADLRDQIGIELEAWTKYRRDGHLGTDFDENMRYIFDDIEAEFVREVERGHQY